MLNDEQLAWLRRCSPNQQIYCNAWPKNLPLANALSIMAHIDAQAARIAQQDRDITAREASINALGTRLGEQAASIAELEVDLHHARQCYQVAYATLVDCEDNIDSYYERIEAVGTASDDWMVGEVVGT